MLDLFEATHPLSDLLEEKGVFFTTWLEHQKNADKKQTEKARLSADPEVASRIIEILGSNSGVVVQYGIGHTLKTFQGLFPERENGILDIDGTLRAKGIGVMILDPAYGEETITCPPMMDQETCIHWPAILEKMETSISIEKDPDRYSIPDIKKRTMIQRQ